jgi:hypothetical protein
MNDNVTEINKAISVAKQQVESYAFSGLLFCGDFNFPSVEWNTEGPLVHDTLESNAQKFAENIEDHFLTQFVNKPTFQLDDSTCNNILDLIFSDCPERINDTIYHFPPMGNLDKAHHILRWNFKLKASKLCNSNQLEVKCFNLGDYNKMDDFFSNIDWTSELNKVDVDQCYEIFLKHYRRACDMFIPTKKIAPAVSNPKWLNKIIKQKAKCKKNCGLD